MESSNADLRSKLIEIAYPYADQVLEPLEPGVLVNVYISGSVSYGFCDELSDLEIEFYFPQGSSPEIVRRVEKSSEDLPEYQGVRMGAGISQWPLEKIVSGNLDLFWENPNPYTVYELMTAVPIREDVPLIDQVKQKIPFYPKDTARRVVNGLWLTAMDSGAYNAEVSLRRNQAISANIFFFRGVEALYRLAFLANEQYFPHTKWLVKALGTLKEDFGLGEFANQVPDLEMDLRIAAFKAAAERVSAALVQKGLLAGEYQPDPWAILADDYSIFSTF